MGNSDVVEEWQAKVHVDIVRRERIHNKETFSRYERTHREDWGWVDLIDTNVR